MGTGNAPEFGLQERVCRAIKRDRPTFRGGISLLRSQLSEVFPGIAWATALKVDWNACQRSWDQWFAGLVDRYPPPALRILWFETPSSLADTTCTTAVTGWVRSESADELYGADAPASWPLDASGQVTSDYSHTIPELAAVIDRVWSSKRSPSRSKDEWDPRELAVHAIEAAVSQLLVQNGLPKSLLFKRLSKRTSIGVLTGWKAAPDVYALGGLSVQGWGRMPAPSKPPPGEPVKLLPLESWDPRRYLRRGGDPNYQNPETGESLLHSCNKEEAIVKALIDAGIDLTLRDRFGKTGLMEHAAGSIKTVRLLLAKGADLHAVDNRGRSFVDHTIWPGTCTGKHLDFLVELGFKLPPDLLFRCVAGHGCFIPEAGPRIKSRLVAAIKHGFDVNERNADGLTPLWVTLRKHKPFGFGPAGVDRDPREHRYDLVAIMLLDHGADPNMTWPLPAEPQIPAGATPLMLESYWTEELVRSLLRHGADPHARSSEGRTSLEYAERARESPHFRDRQVVPKIIAMLRKAMNKPRR